MTHQLPICVDLDGTLLRTDVLSEALVVYIKQYPWHLFRLLGWFLKGRAYLKKKISDVIDLDISVLPVNQQIVALIQQYKAQGHQILLVTAAPHRYGKTAVAHFDFFDDVMTSDENCNLRSREKAQALIKRFGESQFCYMGNSGHDIPVWRHAGEIIAINAPFWVVKKIWTSNKPYTILEEGLIQSRDLLKLIFASMSQAELYLIAPIIALYGLQQSLYFWYHRFSSTALLSKIIVLVLLFVILKIVKALDIFLQIRRDQTLSKKQDSKAKTFDNQLSQALAQGQIPLGFIIQLALICLISVIVLTLSASFE